MLAAFPHPTTTNTSARWWTTHNTQAHQPQRSPSPDHHPHNSHLMSNSCITVYKSSAWASTSKKWSATPPKPATPSPYLRCHHKRLRNQRIPRANTWRRISHHHPPSPKQLLITISTPTLCLWVYPHSLHCQMMRVGNKPRPAAPLMCCVINRTTKHHHNHHPRNIAIIPHQSHHPPH